MGVCVWRMRNSRGPLTAPFAEGGGGESGRGGGSRGAVRAANCWVSVAQWPDPGN